MTAQKDYPFSTKGGRLVLPEVGQQVYVPPRKDHLVGGLAKVVSVAHPKPLYSAEIAVEEHPGMTYCWGELKRMQMEWHRRLGDTRARVFTPEELATVEAEKAATEAATAEELRKRWEPQRFLCANGAMIQVPARESHKRGRNWAAIIDIDPLAPNGISRFWFNRGRGPCIYILPAELQLFDPVEFGADYVRGSGWKDPDRWYGVVYEMGADYLLLKPCADATDAILHAKKKRAESGEQVAAAG